MKKIIVVGNGFDLNLGIKNSYGDFVEYLKRNYSLNNTEVYDFNPLFIKESKQNSTEWSDFEKWFESRIFQLNKINNNDSFGQLEVRRLNNALNQLEIEFGTYLKMEYQRWMNGSSTKVVNPFYLKLFEDALVLNFNYTNTIDDLGIYYKKCFHLHGSLQDDNIIFGSGILEHPDVKTLKIDGSFSNDKLVRIKRDNCLFEERIDLNEYLNFITNNDFEIHFLGHSISGSDFHFLKPYIEKSKKIVIYHYQKDFEMKLSALISECRREDMEKTSLVPFLSILPNQENSRQVLQNESSNSLESWGIEELLLLQKLFNFNIPKEKLFSNFYISSENFDFQDIRQIRISSDIEAQGFVWLMSQFNFSEKEKIPSVSIVIENCNDQFLNTLLINSFFKEFFRKASSISILNSDIFWDSFYKLLEESKCKHLVLISNRIQHDINTRLNINKLLPKISILIQNNRFYKDEIDYEIPEFNITISKKHAEDSNGIEYMCIDGNFEKESCIDLKEILENNEQTIKFGI